MYRILKKSSYNTSIKVAQLTSFTLQNLKQLKRQLCCCADVLASDQGSDAL